VVALISFREGVIRHRPYWFRVNEPFLQKPLSELASGVPEFRPFFGHRVLYALFLGRSFYLMALAAFFGIEQGLAASRGKRARSKNQCRGKRRKTKKVFHTNASPIKISRTLPDERSRPILPRPSR